MIYIYRSDDKPQQVTKCVPLGSTRTPRRSLIRTMVARKVGQARATERGRSHRLVCSCAHVKNQAATHRTFVHRHQGLTDVHPCDHSNTMKGRILFQNFPGVYPQVKSPQTPRVKSPRLIPSLHTGFEKVLDLLDDACEGLLESIREKYGF